MSDQAPQHVEWDDVGDDTIVLLPARLPHEPYLEAIGDELFRLVEQLGRRRLRLHFSQVPFLTSGALAVLIRLRKRLLELGGSLSLCQMHPRLYEVLEITRLLPHLHVVKDTPVSHAPPVSEPEAAFLRAMRERPDDESVRLMFADWLQEQGDPRGEFIHLQCLLSRIDDHDERLGWLRQREQELLQRHEKAWTAAVRPFVAGLEFRAGMIEVVAVEAERFLAHAERLFEATPLRHVKFLGSARLVSRLAECEYLGRLAEVQFNGNYLSDAEVRMLVSSPHLRNLRGLHLGHNRITNTGAQAIAASPNLPALERLTLAHNQVGDAGARALAASDRLPSLCELDLSSNWIGDQGARALAMSGHLEHLRLLDLSEGPIIGTAVPGERNQIGGGQQQALRNRFGEGVCRF